MEKISENNFPVGGKELGKVQLNSQLKELFSIIGLTKVEKHPNLENGAKDLLIQNLTQHKVQWVIYLSQLLKPLPHQNLLKTLFSLNIHV